MRCLPALVLALSFAWAAAALAQATAPTERLFRAVEVNDMGAVKAAIADGADLAVKNADGKTAADVAVDKGHFIIAHFLLSQRNIGVAGRRSAGNLSPAPADRLQKAEAPAARQAKPRQLGQTTLPDAPSTAPPRKLTPTPPDSKTRVTEPLAPAPATPKPKPKTGQVKIAKYGIPPRKPPPPVEVPGTVTREIVVAASPGVETPSGDEPVGIPSQAPPKVPADRPSQRPAAPVADEPAAASAQPDPEPASARQQAPAGAEGPVAVVRDFFKSVFDLVTQQKTPAPPQPPRETAQLEPSQATGAPDALPGPAADGSSGADPDTPPLDDLMAIEDVQSVDDEPAAAPRDGGGPSTDLADELLMPETVENPDGEQGLQPEWPGEPPISPVAEAPESSASARTLERIKNLLGDDPKEDEFGLPEVELPTRETIENDASDTVLEELVDSGDAPAGFLDDRPGPETGPGREAIDDSPAPLQVSDALRARLRRMGDAVTREVTVDTREILHQGRNRAADPLYQPSEQRARAPRPLTHRRTDQVVSDAMRPEGALTRRQTAADRFADRLARIRQMEQAEAPPAGPSGDGRPAATDRQRVPEMPTVAPLADADAKAEPAQDKGTAGEPKQAILDRIAGFFGGGQTQPSAVKPERPDPEAPEYRGSPSTRKLPEGPPAPEIENLQAFDQAEASEPAQAPGSLEPVFLDRLAGLFNEEEANQAKGWKAEVKTEDPFPGRGQLVPQTGGSSWTTTVEMNVGEGKEPVVIQVAQTPDEGLESAALEQAAPAGQPSRTTARGAPGKADNMAREPYGDPLREPEKQQVAERQKTFFGRLTKLFQPKDPVDLKRESLMLEPDEKLSTAHDAEDGGVKVATRTEGDPKTYWPITQLTKSDAPISAPPRRGALTRTSLTDVTLTLGESVSLENLFPPGKDGIDPNNLCVKKNRGTTLFCIEPVDWPAELQQSFLVATILYTGSMAIVRYDQAAATRLHALFSSDDFDRVAAYYQKKFGEPTEILKRSIAPLAKPRQDNPTLSWRSKDQRTNAVTVLEIRKYDDTRGGFPDTSRGAVMLYYSTSPSIFPQVSAHELMRLKRIGDITQSEAEMNDGQAPDAPPAGGPAVSEDELFGSEPLPESQAPLATDTTLDALPGLEPAPASDAGLFERPEDILSEPDLSEPVLSEPDLGTPAEGEPSFGEPVLSEPDLLAPDPGLPDLLQPAEPQSDLLAPDIRAGDALIPRAPLGEEPLTDEPPDEIIEILPPATGNPS